jgi:hypothetical protein
MNEDLNYFIIGKSIYEGDGGEIELSKFIGKTVNESNVEDKYQCYEYLLYCPSCGLSFLHNPKKKGKVIGIIIGIGTGLYYGGQIGIAGGPLGAIAGTIPGAIIGGYIGNKSGNMFDKPKCLKCKTSFEFPHTDDLILVRNLEKEKNKIIKKIIFDSKGIQKSTKIDEYYERKRIAKEDVDKRRNNYKE